MRKMIPLLMLGLALSAGCGKKELSDEDREEAEMFMKEVTAATDVLLENSMAVHQRFLKVRKEEPKSPLRPGNAPLCDLDEKTENPTTNIFFYDTEVDLRFPEKYQEISYWSASSVLIALMETPLAVQAELNDQTWDSYLFKTQYEEFAQAVKDRKYAVIIEGQKKAAIVQTNKETGKKAYVPGFFIGTGFVFEIDGAKYMGQFPVTATNDAQVYVSDWESAQSALDSDLHSEIRSTAFEAIRKAKASK